MSSESISPKAFYGQRGFGYKHWHPITENPFENSLLLYEEMPAIMRSPSDYDDYPMNIAVCVPEADIIPTRTPGVWQCTKTIYLNPNSTTFFFDTTEHKQIALSKAESSAETKMVSLYQSRMYCAIMNKRYDISSCYDTPLHLENIRQDQRINKMKGFLYGYYIGAALSMTEQDVAHLNILNKIKNIFAAILASLEGKATNEQIAQLHELFGQLKQFDPLRIAMVGIIESSDLQTEVKIDQILYLINRTGRSSYSYVLPYLMDEILKGKQERKENWAMSWINKTIQVHIENAKSRATLLRPENGEITMSALSLSSVHSKNVKAGKPQQLFIAIVNDVLASDKYNGKISPIMMSLATDITLKAKEVFAEEWDGSCQAKNYLNALRRHIGGEDFNPQWNAGILGSIAAVVLKGDNWEILLDFLRSKGIADYRLAFALYGELNGFANLTRDFSDIILKEDPGYVNTVYQSFHKQIHGTEAFAVGVPPFIIPDDNTPLRIHPQGMPQHQDLSPINQYPLFSDSGKEIEASPDVLQTYLVLLGNISSQSTKFYKEMKNVSVTGRGETLDAIIKTVLSKLKIKNDYLVKVEKALELTKAIHQDDRPSFTQILDSLNLPAKIQNRLNQLYNSAPKANPNSNFTGSLFGTHEQQ